MGLETPFIFFECFHSSFFAYQIAERRKVVSSIKSSLADAKGTYDGGSGSLSDVDTPHEDKDYNVASPSAATTPITDVQKDTRPAISQDFVESKREVKRDLADEGTPPLSRSSITEGSQTSSTVSSAKRTLNVPPETSKSGQETPLDVNSRKSLVDVPGKKIQSYMPSLRKESSAQSHVEQKNENLEGSSAEANKETEEPVNVDEKPPPLAGTNVMNIILVAAECAPWSKTGIFYTGYVSSTRDKCVSWCIIHN